MTKEDYRSRMRRRSPGTTVKIPGPDTPAPAADDVPNESRTEEPASFPENTMSIHELAALTKGGSEVPMPRARDMTKSERDMVEKGVSPSQRLTRSERESLVKCGWEDGDPIPADFSKTVQKIFNDYVAKEQAKGISLEDIKVTDISDLPPEEQERLRKSMREAIESVRDGNGRDLLQPSPVVSNPQPESDNSEFRSAYPESVVKAMQDVGLDTPANADVVSATPPSPEPLEGAKPVISLSRKRDEPVICRTCGSNAYAPRERLTCPHCGSNAVDDPDSIEIDSDDKHKFLLSLGTRQPFCKKYMVFGNTIEVWVRALSKRELDDLQLWSLKVAARELREAAVGSPVSQADVFARSYFKEQFITTLFQVKSVRSTIEGADLCWRAPDIPYPTIKDWENAYGFSTIDQVVDAYAEEIGSESLILAIQDVVALFNRLNYRLSSEAANTQNFWEGI